MNAVITIPESAHAILSPSKAHMWLTCKGALGAAKGKPRKPPSRHAAEGTVYHDVARRALVEGRQCKAMVGDRYQVDGFEFTVDADNAEYAQGYVDRIRAIPGKRFIEVDLEYSALLGVPKNAAYGASEGDEQYPDYPVAAGTGDCIVLDYDNRIVWGVDLKFGRGDIVYASELVPGTDERRINPQGGLYLAAAVARYALLGIEDDWKVIFVIDQPRANHYDRHTMTVGELKAWTRAQRDAANRAYVLWTWGPERVGVEDLTPSEKACRWCPLSGNCKAQDEKILGQFPKGHAAEVIPTLTQMDDVQIADALDRADEIEHWLSAVRAEGLARALQGHVLPNWKLVQGRRGNRSLPEDVATTRVQLDVPTLREMGVDADEPTALPIEDAVHFALGNGAYKPRELLTVAKLQKPLEKKAPLLWAALQAHITQSEGKPALERMEDPRPPLAMGGVEFPITGTGAASLI